MTDIGPASPSDPRGIGPAQFLGIGVFLFALKFALDRTVARLVFERDWSILNYLIPNETDALPMLPPHDRAFYLTMFAVALPFVAIGIIVTLRRLADASLSRWLVALFFVPVVNLLFFAALSVLPSAGRRAMRAARITEPRPSLDARTADVALEYGTDDPTPIDTSLLGPFIPKSTLGSALVAVFAPAGNSA